MGNFYDLLIGWIAYFIICNLAYSITCNLTYSVISKIVYLYLFLTFYLASSELIRYTIVLYLIFALFLRMLDEMAEEAEL